MHVSPMGLGTSAFGGVYDEVNDAECAAITQSNPYYNNKTTIPLSSPPFAYMTPQTPFG